VAIRGIACQDLGSSVAWRTDLGLDKAVAVIRLGKPANMQHQGEQAISACVQVLQEWNSRQTVIYKHAQVMAQSILPKIAELDDCI